MNDLYRGEEKVFLWFTMWEGNRRSSGGWDEFLWNPRTFTWSQIFGVLEKDGFRLESENLITSGSLWGSIGRYPGCPEVAQERPGMQLSRETSVLVLTVLLFV